VRENPLISPTAAPEITVVDEPGRQRFEIRVDGEMAGFTEYRRSPGLIAFIHTLIDPRFEGQGLGTRLVTDALSQVRAAGLAVLPCCPFVRAFIADHTSEYLDLVPEGYRSQFGLPANG
jgi:predicted GNAT family acetyltransferase